MSFSPGDFSEWSLLAEGGEAEVFRARQASLDRLVAIKRLKLTAIGDEGEVGRFEREAKLCASLNHPSLVQIYDYGRSGKFYYLVMEFVEGIDLGKLIGLPGGDGIHTVPALAESVKIPMARQMVEVVDFIHRKGVLHRDLKPENFVANRTGHVKLLDLGLARPRLADHREPTGGVIKGTLAYVPPEMLRGSGAYQTVSEYYSLALVLLEFFADLRIQTGRTASELLSLIQLGIPLGLMPKAPDSLKSVLAPYLDPDPQARPPTLQPMLKGLKSLQGGSTLGYSKDREALEAAVRREQKAWLWALVRGLERSGRLEEAFARLRELLEVDPEDVEAQVKFRELGMGLNEPAPAILIPKGPRLVMWLSGAVFALGVASAWIFYLQSQPGAEDLGRELMQREMNLLSTESEARESQVAAGVKVPRPASPPYGILIVTGLPENHQVLVNRVPYQPQEEIHLPARRYLLEIKDNRSRPVFKDSIMVGVGEPTVMDFAGRAMKP